MLTAWGEDPDPYSDGAPCTGSNACLSHPAPRDGGSGSGHRRSIDCYCCYHLSVIYETVAESFFVSKENQTSDHPQLLTWARYYSAGRRGDEG